MEIIYGKTVGFCSGVKRTIDLAKKELENRNKVYCLGGIVHNSYVVEELIGLGMIQIESLKEAEKGSSVIIRSHGVPPEIYEEAKKKKIEIIDLTCPKVKAVQNLAHKHKGLGQHIIIIGEKDHAEVIGIKGWAGENSHVITEVEEVEQIDLFDYEKTVVLSQTTYSMNKFEQIENLFKANSNVEVINTICHATQERQEETMKIASEVDLMVVIGGTNSSNAQKLYDISKELCKEALFVQNKNDIHGEEFVPFQKIGVMAGVSIPHELIEEIIEKIKSEVESYG